MPLQPPIFVRKTYGAKLYKWAPQKGDKTPKKQHPENPYYCNATAGSQGQDWITTYCYNQVVTGIVISRYAYVACDYVA